jgi:transcriptional regulator with XRE-family HTH domain
MTAPSEERRMTLPAEDSGQRDRTFVHDLGLRVRAARESAGLSQSGLERAAGLPATTVTRLERGEQDIAVHELDRIAGVLGTDLPALIPPAPAAVSQPNTNQPRTANDPDQDTGD